MVLQLRRNVHCFERTNFPLSLQFGLRACAAAITLLGASSVAFDYNTNINTNSNNSNTDFNFETLNINSYSDNAQEPANSYIEPLKAQITYKNNADQSQTLHSFNYNRNRIPVPLPNNNIYKAPRKSRQREQYKLPQPRKLAQQFPSSNDSQAYLGSRTERQLNNAASTSKSYEDTAKTYKYNPQNIVAPSGSSTTDRSVGTSLNFHTSFSSQARQILAPVAEYNPLVQYSYSYNVHDDNTGDTKSHTETRDGYFVKGSYSVIDPDGFQRTVSYTVDGANGFNAIVKRVPYALSSAVAVVGSNIPFSSAALLTELVESSSGKNVRKE